MGSKLLWSPYVKFYERNKGFFAYFIGIFTGLFLTYFSQDWKFLFLSAIVAGLFANLLADNLGFGPVAPFDAAACFLAVGMAIIVAVFFAVFCDIMVWPVAAIFGLCFAFIGQFGDLAESMIKRDAEQKDSANNVPGFGGILDIIDSPLLAAPFAYVFFMCSV